MGMRGIAGKVALVTGASAGIGRQVALCFAEHGARVALCARREPEGGEVAAEIVRRGGEALFVRADVTRASEVQAVVGKVLERFGQLDFAVNNAGVQGPLLPTAEYEEEEFDRIVAVNLKGSWLCMKYELKAMRGGGAIVNIVSAAGLTVFPTHVSAYTASKHGTIGLTKTAAIEYAPQGVRVNAVCPGAIETEMSDRLLELPEVRQRVSAMHALGRIGKVEEVAPAAVWLCSQEASFITGHALLVDGGALAGKF